MGRYNYINDMNKAGLATGATQVASTCQARFYTSDAVGMETWPGVRVILHPSRWKVTVTTMNWWQLC